MWTNLLLVKVIEALSLFLEQLSGSSTVKLHFSSVS